MIMLTSDGGMGERGISSPIAAPAECLGKPDFRCKPFHCTRFPYLTFQGFTPRGVINATTTTTRSNP